MIFHIEERNIPEALYTLPVVIYGGGYFGRIVCRLLSDRGVKVSYIVDDNERIQGEIFNGVEIISFSRFLELYKNDKNFAITLGTLYGMSVLKKLEKLTNVRVYELYEWFNEVCGLKQTLETQFSDEACVRQFYVGLDSLSSLWADDESRRVVSGLRDYVETRNINAVTDICTSEEYYFIPEVLEAVSHLKEGLKIIDGGAYWGELLQTVKRQALTFEKCYCFEADQKNFKKLQEYASSFSQDGKQICVNKGLWSSEGSLYFEGGQETSSKVVDHVIENKVEVTSIDAYFKDERCNFIKMNIEGAEYEALKGSIHTIERDRPIMAISIYHNLEDFWRIPQYLMDRLGGAYRYYVRHHAMLFCKTILYAIPERM